jgi:hypothetical protein
VVGRPGAALLRPAGTWFSHYRVVLSLSPTGSSSDSTLAQPSTMRSLRVIDSAARQRWESADKADLGRRWRMRRDRC